MTNYTNRLKFPVPDFALKPWQQNLLACFQQIDETIFQSIVNAGSQAWGNSTAWVAGQIAVDVQSGTFWICLVSHTSADTGTFAEDRELHPTFWGLSTTAPEARGSWVSGTAYINTDFVTFNNGFYICTVSHTAGVFAEDLAAGRWAVLIDLAPIIASINDSLQFIAEFEDTYLGSKASAPTTDNNGGALKAGDMYFNTSTNNLNIYNGSAWVAIAPGAPDSIDYVVKTSSGSLSAERVATDGGSAGNSIFDWSVAGQVKVLLRASAADKMLYSTGANIWAEQQLSAYIRTLLDDSTAAAARLTLGAAGVGGDTFGGQIITAGSTGALSLASGTPMLEVRGVSGAGNAAYMSFHRPGAFAAHFGLDTDNVWKVGGWSHGAGNAYTIWHAGNFTPSTKADLSGSTFTGAVTTNSEFKSQIGGGVTGIIRLGSSGAQYVYFDGTNLHLNGGAGLYYNGAAVYHTGNLTGFFSSAIYGLTNYGGGQVGLNLANAQGIGSFAHLASTSPINPNDLISGTGLSSDTFGVGFGTWRNIGPVQTGTNAYGMFMRVA